MAEIGTEARDQNVLDYFEIMGLGAMAPTEVGEALKRGLGSNHHLSSPIWTLTDLSKPPFARQRHRFMSICVKRLTKMARIFCALYCLDVEARVAALIESVREVVAVTVKMPVSDIDLATPLANLGIASLMTVELQMGLSVKFGAEFSTMH